MAPYDFLQRLFWFFIGTFAPLLPRGKARRFLEIRGRALRDDTLRAAAVALSEWKSQNPGAQRVFWVHVASAGELEQAIPPLRALVEKLPARVFLTYFSPSAEPFLKNVPGLVAALGFPPDSPTIHKNILTALNVTDVVLVRYDVWPGLVVAASERGVPIHLFAATAAFTRKNALTPLSRRLRESLYGRMSSIFAVTPPDQAYFASLGMGERTHLAGDPKWARARDRAMGAKAQRSHSRIGWFLDLCDHLKQSRALVIFGSPHAEEHDLALRCSAFSGMAILYVPHDVGGSHVATVRRDLEERGLRTVLFSELEAAHPSEPQFDAVVVDRVGFLAELYGVADAAIVGGGFDGQVHNTLEPAAHPVPTLFGDNVARAQEARQLLDSGAALGFASPQDMLYFIERCFRDPSRLSVIRSESDHPLALARRRAAAAFADIPNTSEIVCAVLDHKAV